MNLSGPGITYLLMVIPTLFALVVVGQGVYKVIREERDGVVVLSFGVTFLLVVVVFYFFFIR